MKRFMSQGCFVFLIAALVLCCSSCVRYRINYTAAKTGIPVLLSSVDRIGGPDDRTEKKPAESIDDKDKIRILVQGFESISATQNSPDQSVFIHASNVDKQILKRSLGKPEYNMYIDDLEVDSFAVYMIVGLMDRSRITTVGHLENTTLSMTEGEDHETTQP